MKDSGLQWVGKIPAEWEVAPLAWILKIKPPEYAPSEELLSVYLDKGVIRYSDVKVKRTNLTSQDLSKYQLVLPGEFVLNNQQAWRGSVGVSSLRGIVSPAYIVMLLSESLDASFANYLLRSSYMVDCYAISSRGVGTIQRNLYWKLLRTCRIAVPPLAEQRSIAAFLDSVTGKIDELRGKLKREIDRLKDYKKSAITKAVCHGLDPKAKMKDSGVAWCPKVPSHWKRVNPRALFSQRTRRAMRGERQLAATQRYGVIYQDDYMRRENQSLVLVDKGFSILKHVEPGDFVISMRSFQGGLEYSENRGSISSAYTMIYGNPVRVENRFYRWFFKSSKYINALQSTSNLTREGQAMRFANFTSIPLFDIPLDEQRRIADYLDGMAKRVNAIVEKRKRQLDALDKLKRTVVYDYVTGKREVPLPKGGRSR